MDIEANTISKFRLVNLLVESRIIDFVKSLLKTSNSLTVNLKTILFLQPRIVNSLVIIV
jgi:hypothetical protein